MIKFSKTSFYTLLIFLLFLQRSSNAAELSNYTINDSVISICQIDLRHNHLKMFWKDENGRLFSKLSTLRTWLQSKQEELVCATNAGIYDEKFQPLGLYIENGVLLRKLNVRKHAYGNFYLQPNGVFLLKQQQAMILDTDSFAAADNSFSKDILFATQSGPLLLQNRIINSLFSLNSVNRLIRNAVCIKSAQQVVIAISRTPISFYEFALFLRDKIGCVDALYMDGGISQYYPDFVYDYGPGFAAMIGVTK